MSPDLSPAVRVQLAEASRDSTLEPWQRAIMQDVALRGARPSATLAPTVPSPLRPDHVAADDGQWIGPGTPSQRWAPTATYDPAHDRMIVFGGGSGAGYESNMWVLSLGGVPTWTQILPLGTPPAGRVWSTAVYDPVGEEIVVFGGMIDAAIENDVWALKLLGTPTWSKLMPAGPLPPARYGHTATYDPVRYRMVVFGGSNNVGGSGAFGDVWALSLTGTPTWSDLTPTGNSPSARYGHSTIYDPVRDRMVMFGGWDGLPRNDVWALSLGESPAWSELIPTGTPPVERIYHTSIYDPVRDRMVVFGGASSDALNDTWGLSLAGSPAWSAITVAGSRPPVRFEHAALYDPVRDRMVIFAGDNGGGNEFQNDVWALSLPGSPMWSDITPGGSPPHARFEHAAVYDPVRDRMLVFSGLGDNGPYNGVWVQSLGASPMWSLIAPTGVPPSGRYGHSAIYDPLRDRVLVFGGANNGGSPALNDTWSLSLSGSPAWSKLLPSGTLPPARLDHAAVYDPVRDRMLVFGGATAPSQEVYLNDVWSLSLGGSPAWSELIPGGDPPSARGRHAAIYDPVGDRMVVFGGQAHYMPPVVYSDNDVWTLSLAGSPAWSRLPSGGLAPIARLEHTAIYDPVNMRMVVFGGAADVFRGDTWAFSLSGSPAWTELAPVGEPPTAGRASHSSIYDPVRHQMVVFGGISNQGLPSDVWRLVLAGPVSVPEGGNLLVHRFELVPPRPNPSAANTLVEFRLSQPGRVALDVFDTQGRQVKRIVDAWFPAGNQVETWKGDDERGQPVGIGVYFIRMQSGDFQAMRRTVRIR